MYEDLIKQLRYCANSELVCEETSSCPYYDKAEEKTHFYHCVERLIGQAADAIEELQDTVQAQDKALKLCADQLARRWTPVTERLPACEWGAEVGNIEWISCGMVSAGCFGRGGKYRDAYFRTWTDGTEGIDAKDADYWRPIQIPELPKDGEINMSCPYCHEDRDGYVIPIEKNCHAYIVFPDTLRLKFDRQARECKINYCPMCGRKLSW